MANTLRFKRGLVSTIPTALAGEPLFTTDTFDLYIGNGTSNTRFQKYIASGTTSQLLRGDGSLLTMPIVLTSPANGQVLKYDGTNWVNSADAGVTGSGTTGQVTYWGSSSTITGSNNLFWDASNNRLGIGTNSPASTLDVSRAFTNTGLSGILSNPILTITNPANWGYPVGIVFRTPMTNGGALTNIGSIWCEWQSDNNTYLGFATNTSGTVSEKMRIFATGNVAINSTTDSGQRLQVTGTSLFTGASTFNSTITASSFIRSGGTSTQYLMADGSTSTLTNPVTGTGVSGQVAYWSGTNTQTGSNNLFWDATNSRLGVGTTTPNVELAVYNASVSRFHLQNLSSGVSATDGLQFAISGLDGYIWNWENGGLLFATNNTQRARITSGGNFIINNASTDSGQRLQVIGDTLMRGSGNTSATTALRVQNSDTLQLFQILNNGNVGFPDASSAGYTLNVGKNITGSIISAGIWQNGNVIADVTTNAIGIYNLLRIPASTAISSYQHFRAESAAFGAGATLGTQIGFIAENSLNTATNNFGFYGNIASGTGRWNLYMNGTANNYIAGNLGIGSTSLNDTVLRVSKNITGGVNALGIYIDGAVQNDVTSQARGLQISPTIASGTAVSDLIYYFARQNTFTGTATNQYAVFVDGNLTGATNNYAFYSNIASGTGRWNLYMNGTAPNYLNGGLLIGTTTYSMKLTVIDNTATYVAQFRGSASSYITVGDTALGGESGVNLRNSSGQAFIGLTGTVLGISATSGAVTLAFNTAGTERGRITNNGLLLGSTSDTGERLQVTGTMRVSGASTLIGSNTTVGTFALEVQNSAATVLLRARNDGSFSVNGGVYSNLGSTSTNGFTACNSDSTLTSLSSSDIAVRFTDQRNAANAGYSYWFATLQYSNLTYTSGTGGFVNISRGYAPTSGTGVFNSMILQNVINQTGGANGITRGLYINPTLTAAADWRSIETSNNSGWAFYAAGTAPSFFGGAATFSSTAQAAGFITSGGAGYAVINSAANTVTALRPTGGGTNIMSTNSNGLHIAVGTQATGDLILATNNTERIRLSSNGFFSQVNGTNPSSSITDSYIQYSADIVAGNAAPHFRTENGAVIKLYQQDNSVAAANFVAGIGTAVTTLDAFDGYTIGQVVKALRNAGILS